MFSKKPKKVGNYLINFNGLANDLSNIEKGFDKSTKNFSGVQKNIRRKREHFK